MLSKEEILTYVQQGQAQPGWNVLKPNASYLTKQALIYGALTIAVIIVTVIFLSQNYVFGYFLDSASSDTLAVWRYIDIAILIVLFGIFLVMALRNVLELNTLQHQLLVMMPDGFLLKKRNIEQFVAYAGVTGISVRVNRYGFVTLNVKAVGSNAVHNVQLDGRYGNARALASQIVGAQRQYAKNQRTQAARG